MRVRYERNTGRGLGLFYTAGNLGTTYGEEGWNKFFCITVLILLWSWSLDFTWKSPQDGIDRWPS